MSNALILHGTGDSSSANWFPWLKKALEMRDYSAWVPDLPGADEPDPAKYIPFLLSDHHSRIDPGSRFTYNSGTILIGHSSGAIALLHLLPHLAVTVKAVYLVAPFIDDLGWKSLRKLFPLPDLGMVKSKSRSFTIIHSDDDPYCPMSHAAYLQVKLGAHLTILPKQKHFSVSTAGEQYLQFPELLQMICES